VVNLGSNAVANTLPAGGALAMGVSWAMLSSWGISTPQYVLYTLVSGIWNVFARLGLPVLALVILATASRPGAGLIAAAAVGLALLAAMAVGLGLLMRSESFAVRAGRVVQLVLVTACRVARRPASFDIPGSLLGFRDRAGALIASRGWRITVATAASNLTLWLVLLACLRGIGLSQAQVPWQTSLAAFAFVRLLTVLPVTPGGLGITELGLIATLAAGHRRRAVVPGRHVPAPHSPRRDRVPHLALRARPHSRQAGTAPGFRARTASAVANHTSDSSVARAPRWCSEASADWYAKTKGF
jgi:uncharacterized membrane protein YbhN (UPF0104 family)